MPMIEVKTEAPDFTIPNQDGIDTSLSALKGKWVVLWWYPKADTPGWTIEGKGFRDRIHDFEAKRAVILGVSCDTPGENKAFKDKFDFPYDLLCDTDRGVSMTYGAADSTDAKYPKRISYLIDPEGKIAKVYAEVKPADHPDQVLADIPWA